MKKVTVLALLGLLALPSIASAAWWNPFTWGKAIVADGNATTSTSTVDTSLLPTTDDLYKRISELEMKLDDARTKLSAAEAVATQAAAKVSSTAAPAAAPASSGLSATDVSAKVKPALVLVETATSSAAGTIIDAQGHILTNAHAVWTKDASGNVIGAASTATITLANGTKTIATLVGIEEASDIAILQLASKKSSSYVTLNYGSSAVVGDKVYLFGVPGTGANGGLTFTSGVIASKTSSAIQATTDDKTLDNGGAMVTNKGALIGIPGVAVCKILEEMKTCLKYTVTVNTLSARIPKVLAGMRLYKDKTVSTPEETLIGGYLQGLYNSINRSDLLDVAVDNVTGENSFDYFNEKLASDTDDKIAKVYLIKLKSGAQNIYLAFDFLKNAAYALHVGLINDSASILKLDDYQQKIVQQIQTDNDARLKDYQARWISGPRRRMTTIPISSRSPTRRTTISWARA